MPMKMRYRFSLFGQIGVDFAQPSRQGAPMTNPDEFYDLRVPEGQIYAGLYERKSDLFAKRKGDRPVWSSDAMNFMIDEVRAGKDIG